MPEVSVTAGDATQAHGVNLQNGLIKKISSGSVHISAPLDVSHHWSHDILDFAVFDLSLSRHRSSMEKEKMLLDCNCMVGAQM